MAKERILVIDDEAEIREIIQLYLVKEGYEVILADNGQQPASWAVQQNRI